MRGPGEVREAEATHAGPRVRTLRTGSTNGGGQMVGGFNTNVRYRGRTFHVQTEDSGPNVAKIVTLLYEGGTILFSRKTAYGKEPETSDREVVRQLMEQQHCAMVEALKSGEFDAEIGLGHASASATKGARDTSAPKPAASGAQEPPTPSAVRLPTEPKLVSVEPRKHRKLPPRVAAPGAERSRRASDEAPVRDFGHGVITQKPLDEIVLAQLAAK